MYLESSFMKGIHCFLKASWDAVDGSLTTSLPIPLSNTFLTKALENLKRIPKITGLECPILERNARYVRGEGLWVKPELLEWKSECPELCYQPHSQWQKPGSSFREHNVSVTICSIFHFPEIFPTHIVNIIP